MHQTVYFIGSPQEIEHHAAPLSHGLHHRMATPEAAVTSARPGDLAIFYCEHFDRFRSAIGALRQRNVATLYMIDGVLEWRNAWENDVDEPACPFTMRPVLSDKVACIGPAQARVLRHWGNAEKVETVGVPRFDRLRKLDRRPRPAAGFRLLVMTAKCPSYTDRDRQLIRRGLQDLKRYLEFEQTDVEPVWRLTAGLDRELGVDNRLTDLTGHELIELLQNVDAVVTSPSTAALEAMLLDLPTAILDYNNTPDYVRSAWKITAREQLPRQIRELLDPPESKLHFQRQILVDELYLESGATERMLRLVDEMLRISRRCVEQGNPIRFPQGMLDVGTSGEPCGPVLPFQHKTLFPQFAEFSCLDRTVLQVELTHARREIKHLHRQIEQLRSELNEAHQIFDEINGHPIAGPVVRLRQKVLQMLHRLKNAATPSELN